MTSTEIRPATAGESFCPEMGGTHDGRALFVQSQGGTYLKWLPERHAEALAAFKALRIRPQNMKAFTTVHGVRKWSASLTESAGRKIIAARMAVYETSLT